MSSNRQSQRVIIFGGPDRCGKTTIAKQLSRVTWIPYFKATNQGWFARNDPQVFEHQTRWAEPKLLDFIQQTGISVIMDRGFPCDWAYSTALGRKTAWDTLEVLDEAYGSLGALLVVTVRKSYHGRSDDRWERIDEETLYKLDDAYRKYAKITKMKTLVMETDDENLDEQVKTIMKEIA